MGFELAARASGGRSGSFGFRVDGHDVFVYSLGWGLAASHSPVVFETGGPCREKRSHFRGIIGVFNSAKGVLIMDPGKKRSQLVVGGCQQAAGSNWRVAGAKKRSHFAFAKPRFPCPAAVFRRRPKKKRSHLGSESGMGASPVLDCLGGCMGGAPMPRGGTIVVGRGLRIILGVAQMPLGWPTYPFD